MFFECSTKETRSLFVVEAGSYEAAAQIAVKRLRGRPDRTKRLFAQRTSGDVRRSGWFQGYRHVASQNAACSAGPAFHITLADHPENPKTWDEVEAAQLGR